MDQALWTDIPWVGISRESGCSVVTWENPMTGHIETSVERDGRLLSRKGWKDKEEARKGHHETIQRLQQLYSQANREAMMWVRAGVERGYLKPRDYLALTPTIQAIWNVVGEEVTLLTAYQDRGAAIEVGSLPQLWVLREDGSKEPLDEGVLGAGAGSSAGAILPGSEQDHQTDQGELPRSH